MTSSPPVFPDSFISISVPEFTVGEIFDFNATDDVDSEGDGLTYVIRTDEVIPPQEFGIDAETGILSLTQPTKIFSNSLAGNAVLFDVVVFDGDGNAASTEVLLELTDVEEAPIFESDQAFIVEDGATGNVGFAVAFDPDDFDATVTFSLSGPDAGLFRLQPDESGFFADIFADTPLTATPANDANGDGIFEVIVTADDGVSTSSILKQFFINGFVPPSLPYETYEVFENEISDIYLNGFDYDGDPLTYSIVGGADAALFEISDLSNDLLRFLSPPDFEAPEDADGDNVYDIVIEVSDGALTDRGRIAVSVRDDPNDATDALTSTFFDFSNAVGPRAIAFTSGPIDSIDSFRAAQDAVSVDAAGATFRAGDLFGDDEVAKISFLGDGLSIRRSSEAWQERRLIDDNDVLFVDLDPTDNFGRAQEPDPLLRRVRRGWRYQRFLLPRFRD